MRTAGPSVAIPRSITEVTAEWVEAALAARYPNLEVRHARVVDNMGGACTKLRVVLETNRPGFPSTIVVKGCLETHNRERMKATQLKEVWTSRSVVASIDVETVEFLNTHIDDEGRSIILMEDLDLRGARCLRPSEPLDDIEIAEKFVHAIARIHARWWNTPEATDDAGPLGWIFRPSETSMPSSSRFLHDPDSFAEIMSRPRASATPRLIRDPDRLAAALDQVVRNREELPMTITHGDPHPSNLYVTADGTPGFLDWTLHRCPGIYDVTYFLISCLDVVDRRRWERKLIHLYLDRLDSCGIEPPSFADAWHAHRSWAVWGEVVWLLNQTDFHSEADCTAIAARFGHAMIDLETFDALDV
jgi:hypothetical protein